MMRRCVFGGQRICIITEMPNWLHACKSCKTHFAQVAASGVEAAQRPEEPCKQNPRWWWPSVTDDGTYIGAEVAHLPPWQVVYHNMDSAHEPKQPCNHTHPKPKAQACWHNSALASTYMHTHTCDCKSLSVLAANACLWAQTLSTCTA